jgi:hypothetical protein
MFAAGFLQTGERIATFSSRFAAGAATDFSFFGNCPGTPQEKPLDN